MYKIMLTYPPLDNQILGIVSEKITATSGFPPISLMILAAQLEVLEDVQIKIVDCRLDNINLAAMAEIIKEFAPDFLGVSVVTFMLLDALFLAEIAKKINPQTTVVFGGVHPSLYPKESINYENVDYLIRGEGEVAIKALVQNLMAGRPVDDIPGVITKRTEHPENVPLQVIENLDELREPAWNMVDVKKCVRQNKPVLWVLTSRGCPGKCTFCHISSYRRRFRYHSVNYIYNHIVGMMTKYQLDEFYIVDDCFTVDRQRVVQFCEMLLKNKIKAQWGASSRVDTIDPDLLKLMGKAGCKTIYLGIESGDPTIQKRINKNLNLDRAKEIIAIAQQCNMSPHGYFMIGLPGETKTELNNTIAFMHSAKLSGLVWGVSIFLPYPQTVTYLEGLASGIIKEDYWLKFAQHPTIGFKSLCWNEHFSDEELMRWQKEINSRFFFRPIIVYRTLKEAMITGRLLSKIRNLYVYLKDVM